jgi:translation initiation factor IF-3
MIKEIKFRPGTDDGDYNIAFGNIKRSGRRRQVQITPASGVVEITHQERAGIVGAYSTNW